MSYLGRKQVYLAHSFEAQSSNSISQNQQGRALPWLPHLIAGSSDRNACTGSDHILNRKLGAGQACSFYNHPLLRITKSHRRTTLNLFQVTLLLTKEPSIRSHLLKVPPSNNSNLGNKPLNRGPLGDTKATPKQ
jgi:hypothetical protein